MRIITSTPYDYEANPFVFDSSVSTYKLLSQQSGHNVQTNRSKTPRWSNR